MTYDELCTFHGRLTEISEELDSVVKEADFRGINNQPSKIKEEIVGVLVDINVNVAKIVQKITQ